MEKIIYISNKLISQLRLYFYSVVFVFFAMNVSQHVSTMYSTFHKCMKLRTSKKKTEKQIFSFSISSIFCFRDHSIKNNIVDWRQGFLNECNLCL